MSTFTHYNPQTGQTTRYDDINQPQRARLRDMYDEAARGDYERTEDYERRTQLQHR